MVFIKGDFLFQKKVMLNVFEFPCTKLGFFYVLVIYIAWCNTKLLFINYSPTSFKTCCISCSLNRKSVSFTLSNKGLSADISPFCLACANTPNVPVIVNPICFASLRPPHSSIIRRQFSFSNAKAIELASPLSRVVSRTNWFFVSGILYNYPIR